MIKKIKNKEAKEFKSLSLSKLVRANISSKDVPFTAMYNVEFLCIFLRPGVTFKSIPVLQNLIHIELWFSYKLFRSWDGIVELLQNCPKLQILFIRKGIKLSLSKDLEFPISAIECVPSNLRSCTIVNFNGSDIPFSTYILQNARLLEVMKIIVRDSSSEGMQEHEIIEKLSTCPRMMSPDVNFRFNLFNN
ncbi:FBD protein [Medicago truncatula]|uniref:FBD protein n=2 Tax=Medicago truncatula TaxID=3880 RepID=G7JAY5_MEDTR|nr:FBD protein [Medicago truncatula]